MPPSDSPLLVKRGGDGVARPCLRRQVHGGKGPGCCREPAPVKYEPAGPRQEEKDAAQAAEAAKAWLLV